MYLLNLWDEVDIEVIDLGNYVFEINFDDTDNVNTHTYMLNLYLLILWDEGDIEVMD